MSVITQAQNVALRTYDKDLNGYVTNLYQVNERIGNSKCVATCLYDQSVNGNILTSADTELSMDLPEGAIITNIYGDVLTTMGASGGTATLDISVDAVKVVSAATEASIVAGVTVFTLDRTKVKLTAATTKVKLRAGTALFETGKMRLFFEYMYARE